MDNVTEIQEPLLKRFDNNDAAIKFALSNNDAAAVKRLLIERDLINAEVRRFFTPKPNFKDMRDLLNLLRHK